MNKFIASNLWRFIFFLLVQVLILKQVKFEGEFLTYLHVFIYPLFILLLPIKMLSSLVLLLAFSLGLIIDWFYDSIGVHTSALVFTAYLRPLVLFYLQPFEGYNINETPSLNNMGVAWFSSYLSILLFLHLFFYFSVEAFSFVFLFDILLNTFLTFVSSFIIIFLSQLIFKFKN